VKSGRKTKAAAERLYPFTTNLSVKDRKALSELAVKLDRSPAAVARLAIRRMLQGAEAP
jgi:predicted transcriptional regulator